MKKFMAFVYGIFCYLVFFGSFVWLVLFLGGFQSLVPTTINSGTSGTLAEALIVDIGLIVLFGVQHTVMARKSFKEKWTRIVPWYIERSTYVLFSSLAVLLLLWFWQPLTTTIWEVEAAWATLLLDLGFWLGWIIVFISTYMIDHFSLFGLRQVWNHLTGKSHEGPGFKEPALYKYVRHPLMLGFIIAFWSVSHMTAGYLVFSIGMTLYIIIGVYYEEKAMVRRFGDEYRSYQDRVGKFFPGLGAGQQ